MELRPIGVIHTPFERSEGTPIQSAFADGAKGTAVVQPQYAEGLKDLEGFERIWLLYWFHKADFRPGGLIVTPFLDNDPRGLFATRAPARPNSIGISPVRLFCVEGNVLHIADVDMLDGTPLLDIKPYLPRFDVFETARNGWYDTRDKQSTVADDRFEKKTGKSAPAP